MRFVQVVRLENEPHHLFGNNIVYKPFPSVLTLCWLHVTHAPVDWNAVFPDYHELGKRPEIEMMGYVSAIQDRE